MVVGSNPARPIMKIIGDENNWKPPNINHCPRINSQYCLWFLLSSRSSAFRSVLVPDLVIMIYTMTSLKTLNQLRQIRFRLWFK